MKYRQWTCLIVFLLMHFFQPLIAQQKAGKAKGAFELNPGLHLLGPSGSMLQLMKVHQFNATTDNWLFGGTSDHPDMQRSGLLVRFSYAHSIGTKSKLGILYGLSNFGVASGAKTSMNNVYYLSLKLTSQQIALFYEYKLFKIVSLKLGPALSINSCNQIEFDYFSKEHSTQVVPGVLAGIRLLFYDGSVVYFGLQSDYLWLMQSKIGPFAVSGFSSESIEFPESKIRYNHMNMGLLLGVHLFKSAN
jgi:hypothetical protein